jgi:hypothetical protein
MRVTTAKIATPRRPLLLDAFSLTAALQITYHFLPAVHLHRETNINLQLPALSQRVAVSAQQKFWLANFAQLPTSQQRI